MTTNPAASPTIRAVVFDIGGVMCKLNPPAELFDAKAVELIMPAVHHLDAGEVHPDDFIAHVAAVTNKPADLIAAVFDGWIGDPYPDFHPLLDDLHAAGLTTACLSNTNARHWDVLAGNPDASPPVPALLPLDRLHHRLTSFEMGRRKPNRDIYDHAAALLSLKPAELVFFDDTEPNVAAARDAGWHAHPIDPTRDTMPQMRDHLATLHVLPA
ncbi:MAG: HAD family phosphatase [Planctomycetota bacterium]